MPYMGATVESLNAHHFTTDRVPSDHHALKRLRDAIGLENLGDDSARPQSSKIIKGGHKGDSRRESFRAGRILVIRRTRRERWQ
jgi:hypothetical protein